MSHVMRIKVARTHCRWAGMQGSGRSRGAGVDLWRRRFPAASCDSPLASAALSGLNREAISLFQISGIRDDIREIRTDIKIVTGKIADIYTRLSLIEDPWKIRP